MDDLKNLTAEKVIPVTPEKQEEMSWEPTTEPPVTPEKQEEEVLLWQPYQTPKYWAYHENYTSDWFDELQDETMVEYMFRGHAKVVWAPRTPCNCCRANRCVITVKTKSNFYKR